jgi:hypothetical protein
MFYRNFDGRLYGGMPDHTFKLCMRVHSGQLTAVLREIRRLGLGFFEVDSAFLKKKSLPGAYSVYAPGCVIIMENGVDLENPHMSEARSGLDLRRGACPPLP